MFSKRRVFIHRSFTSPDLPEHFETIEDSEDAGGAVDETIASLEAERQRFEFFKRYDLIDTGDVLAE